jgi:DNA repair and recombination protein RAD52
MRSFGNQFGNSLYDKTRNQQNQDSSYQQKPNYNQNQSYTNRNQKPPQNNPQQQQPYQNGNNRNSSNVNQNANTHHQTRNTAVSQNNQSFDQYEYQPLFNLGLDVIEQNGFLIVTGDDIFSKKDSIKACGFRFDSASKTWYKPVEQGVA